MLNELQYVLESYGSNSYYRDKITELQISDKERNNRNVSFTSDFLKTYLDNNFSPNHEFSNSSIKLSSENEIKDFHNYKESIVRISDILNFPEETKEVVRKIVTIFLSTNSEKAINISYTGENEFLIYKKEDDGIKNMLISDEGDIEILYIKTKVRDTKKKLFFKEKGLELNSIINEFNSFK